MHLYFSTTKKTPVLQVMAVQSTDIPPKENVTYAKQTQTTASGGAELRDGNFIYILYILTTYVKFHLH